MANLYTEVAKLNLPFLAQGVAETIVTTDQFLGLLPVRDVAPAIQYSYNKENTIATGNSGSVITPDGTFTPMTASYTQTTQNMTTVGASFNMPKHLQTGDAVAVELSKKAKAVARSIGGLLFTADGNGSVSFAGLSASVAANTAQIQTVASVGSGSFSLASLDAAIQLVKPQKPNMLVTNGAGLRYFKSAIRTTGTTAEYLQYENYGSPVLQYDGIPVIQSDFAYDPTASGSAAVYAIYANEVDGVTLWSNMGQLAQVFGPTHVVNSVSDNYSVGASFGLVIPSPLCVSVLTGLTS